MPRKRVTVDSFVDGLRARYPQHEASIEVVLKPYKLPNGSLQNDDSIIVELTRCEKAWKKMIRNTAQSHKG